MVLIDIYTDGGVRGNGKEINVGGWGVVITTSLNDKIKQLYGNEKNTTNNKMELMACIKGLELVHDLTDCKVNVYTDSAYLCNCMNDKWYIKWRKNGWVNSSKEKVKNQELWEKIIGFVEKNPNIKFLKVKGHSGHKYNELVDKLCNKAMDELQ